MATNNNDPRHPYLKGNFAPVQKQLHFESCPVTGTIPSELIEGQYVRNSSNPLPYDGSTRAMHWFDGHGMLSAVYFALVTDGSGSRVKPLYSNRFIHTDIYEAESNAQQLHAPILPSVATMLDPESSLLTIILGVFKTVWVVFWSFISGSKRPIKRISVANTSIISHDDRILATCESGPPMRVLLPELKTIGWFNGCHAEGEPEETMKLEATSGFRGQGFFGFFREWTTGHPHIDPQTKEMILVHSTFIQPFVRYSVLSGSKKPSFSGTQHFGQPVPGILSPHIIHDFGVSRHYTVIIDMPLSLDPFNLVHNEPIISFNPDGRTRLGVFPRHSPRHVRWVTTQACCIFHTVNTWDSDSKDNEVEAQVNMLVCRMTGPSIIFASGNLPVPSNQIASKEECRLYYYQITVANSTKITQQWALSAIPFEFPHVPKHLAMSATTFVYGCSVAEGNYASQLETACKISSLAKVNVQKLLAKGLATPPTSIIGCVDERQVEEILASNDPEDPIQIFAMPEGWYAQECVFVPREGGQTEDDGWLLTFVFDESQLDEKGDAPDDAWSELWAIDAQTMKDVVMRVRLPQRVPYGLHGNWFSQQEIAQQLPVKVFRD